MNEHVASTPSRRPRQVEIQFLRRLQTSVARLDLVADAHAPPASIVVAGRLLVATPAVSALAADASLLLAVVVVIVGSIPRSRSMRLDVLRGCLYGKINILSNGISTLASTRYRATLAPSRSLRPRFGPGRGSGLSCGSALGHARLALPSSQAMSWYRRRDPYQFRVIASAAAIVCFDLIARGVDHFGGRNRCPHRVP